MGKIKDLTGKVFGRLTVISLNNKRDKNGQTLWDCQCICGKQITISSKSLRKSNTPSCGCYNSERITKLNISRSLEKGESRINNLFGSYKQSAKYRGYEFNLTKTFFMDIINKNCYYCNSEPLNSRSIMKNDDSKYNYNGIDRVDNNIGYTEDNCVPCCSICNIAKRALTLEDFKNWVIKIYNNMVKNENN